MCRTGDNSNPNTLERETDLQHEMEAGQGARAAQMTPRRVKRRNRSRSVNNKNQSTYFECLIFKNL